MAEALQTDVLIVGAGQAGIPLAKGLAKAGRSVVLAERRHLGGSCVNFGCTPTKAALASARVAHLARRAGEFGVRTGDVVPDLPAILRRARDIAAESRTHLDADFADTRNPRLLRGHAKFTGRYGDRFAATVGDTRVAADQVVIDVGTRAFIPPIAGLRDVPYIDSGNWLFRDDLPDHLAILGGGYVGLEMAQFYKRMGASVTVVDRSDQVLSKEDQDVAQALQDLLEAEGIEFRLGTKVASVGRDNGTLRLGTADGPHVCATGVFVATGRVPNTDDLGIDEIGVETTDEGFIPTDDRLATSVPGVWAAGDVRGREMFTHTSYDDYRVLMSQLTGDGARTIDRIVPYAVFTDPQLGRIGLTERAAGEAGRRFRVARFRMERNGQARERGEREGIIKLVIEEESAQILGAAVLSAEASEIVHVYVTMMNAGIPVTAMEDRVFIHPTLSEATQSAMGE